MAKDVDLTSREWLDLVFEGKNKEYGAYVLRESSSDCHIKALAIVIIGGMALIFLPRLVKSVAPASPRVIETGNVVMVDIPVKPETPVEIPVMQAASTPVHQLLAKTIQLTPPVIVPDEQAKLENLMEDQATITASGAEIGTTTNLDGVIGGIRPEEAITIVEEPVGDKPVVWVEVPPVFPGGEKELMKWLSNNLVYPAIAIEKGIRGKVLLRFVIGPDGSVGEVEIQRSLDPSCDKEAVRVIKKMPNWIPGKQNGNKVSVYYTLPIEFRLQN